MARTSTKDIPKDSPAYRLQTARIEHYGTASDAARELRIPIPTYSSHENNNRAIPDHYADIYARHFGVEKRWLLNGEEPRYRDGGPDRQVHYRLPSHSTTPDNPLMVQLDVLRDGGRLHVDSTAQRDRYKLPGLAISNGYICQLEAVNTLVDQPQPGRLIALEACPHVMRLQDFVYLGNFHLEPNFLYCVRIRADQDFDNCSGLALVDPLVTFPAPQPSLHVFISPEGLSFPALCKGEATRPGKSNAGVFVRYSKSDKFIKINTEEFHTFNGGRIISLLPDVDTFQKWAQML